MTHTSWVDKIRDHVAYRCATAIINTVGTDHYAQCLNFIFNKGYQKIYKEINDGRCDCLDTESHDYVRYSKQYHE